MYTRCMRRVIQAFCAGVFWCLSLPAGDADIVLVHNPVGGITIRVVAEDAVRVGGSSRVRTVVPGDVLIRQEKGLMIVECRPADGAAVDLDISLPYGVEIEARTKDGFLSLEGLISRAALETGTGRVELAVPWSATELELTAQQAPAEFRGPEGPELAPRMRGRKWKIVHHFPATQIHYGKIVVSARAPAAVVLSDVPIPDDAHVKLPWQAEAVLKEILIERDECVELRTGLPAATLLDEPLGEAGLLTEAGPGAVIPEIGEAIFRSEVRMVNLMVSVTDRKGHPPLGLGSGDFEVIEEGVRQQIASVASEEAPFNLAILLDWSGSTRKDRIAMRVAAQRFVELARPQDKVAVYALTTDLFRVISPLTGDKELVKSRLRQLPSSQGASPIYDAIVLAYDYELRKRPGERNALIILSDGVDNQLRRTGFSSGIGYGSSRQEGMPSKVDFEDLRQAAAVMDTLIYPIFLKPTNVFFGASMPSPTGYRGAPKQTVLGGSGPARWERMAHDRLEKLARQSGGKLFEAKSIRDLKPIFPQVTEELRSVYSVAYYPANQRFDGAWRNVVVKVKRPNAVVRTRPGFVAR